MPQADPLPARELLSMLKALPCARDRMLLILLLATGLRVSEALSLRLAHVATPDGAPRPYLLVHRHATKAKVSARTCWLIPEIQDALTRYFLLLPSLDPAQCLFPSRKGENIPVTARHAARLLLPAFQAAAATGHYTTHSPRKWFARRLHAAMGNDLYATATALGHRSPTSTTYYLSSTQQRIQKAINLSMPAVFAGVANLFPAEPQPEGDSTQCQAQPL